MPMYIQISVLKKKDYANSLYWLQVYSILLCFALLCLTLLCFLQIKVKTIHQHKDNVLLYCAAHFIVVVLNSTHNISEVYLYSNWLQFLELL